MAAKDDAKAEAAHEATVAADGPLEDSDDLSTPPQSPRPESVGDDDEPAIQARPSLVSSHHFRDIYALDTEAKLGEGATAVVYAATNKRSGKRVAVKCFDKSKMVQTEIRDLFAEVGVLKLMKHPHILQLHDFFEEPGHFFIVTDLLEGGELFDRIVEKEFYSEKEARDLIKTLLGAIQYMHDLNVVHRDLKPENILLSSVGDDTAIKIADFGFAKQDFEGKLTDKCGSPEYIAPEILSQSYYGKQVDVWSAGIITFILLCGYPPFSGRNNTVLFNNIKAGRFEFESPYWDDVSADAKAFVRRMLVVDPQQRASVDELLCDVWITGEVSATPLNGVMDEMRRFNARRKFKAAVKTVQATNMMQSAARSRAASAAMTPPANPSAAFV